MNPSIPKPGTPFFDERTGEVSRVWFLYLADIKSDEQLILFWASLYC